LTVAPPQGYFDAAGGEVMSAHVYRVRISAKSKSALIDLLKSEPLDLNCGSPKTAPDGTITIEALVTDDVKKRLEKHPVQIEVVEDATETGRQRQAEVGKGDRFEGGKKPPRGTGKRGGS
jgi:hypothetical protein